MGQLSMFDLIRQPFKIDKPIRLIELFSGYGSQAMALRNLGANFESYKAIEFDKYAMASYNAVHNTNFETTDIRDVRGGDLEINEQDKFAYILFYSFPQTLYGHFIGWTAARIFKEFRYKIIIALGSRENLA